MLTPYGSTACSGTLALVRRGRPSDGVNPLERVPEGRMRRVPPERTNSSRVTAQATVLEQSHRPFQRTRGSPARIRIVAMPTRSRSLPALRRKIVGGPTDLECVPGAPDPEFLPRARWTNAPPKPGG